MAYVLFTSGSSGRPKAVAVTHQALWARLSHLADLWQIGPEDCAGAVARPTFDPSLIALLMPLMRGARLALPRSWRMDQQGLAQFVRQHGVTFAPLVPATLALLRDGLALGGPPAGRLRVVCCGGEALSPALAASFQQQTGARVDNLYGPTEATIYATRWACPPVGPLPPRLPIGRPVAETSLRLLTPEGQLSPSGARGEIAIGGLGLAQGYWQDQDQTATRFITLAHPDGRQERLYLTGDQGCWREDGNLDFLGRQDRQIKINGQRIEPAEIEALLAADPAVSAAVVDARGQACARRLHGWVVSDSATPDALSTRLLDLIADQLPLQMTLASLTVLTKAPLNAAGKIDLQALPTPEMIRPPSLAEAADDEPTTPLEREVAALWAQALGRDGLGLHDNLFALGGDSLSAMAVLTGLERMVGPGLPLSLLVRHPTIASQVRALGEALSHRAVRLAQAKHHDGPAPAPLFITASGHGDALRFRALADALGGGHDVYMLQPPLDSQQQDAPTFARLAASYTAQIAEVLPPSTAQQPVLVGFSLGGVAALETARALAEQGKGVPPLILIDTSYPYASPVGEKAWRLFARLIRRLGLHQRLPWLQRWIAMLDDQGLGWQLKALQRYRPARYDGPVSLLISSGMRPLAAFLFHPWRRICPQRLRCRSVVGMHGTLLRPGRVEALAEVIRALAAEKESLENESR
jgi:amino acid adenylation domain-containing protein